jgi:hypothetical protein
MTQPDLLRFISAIVAVFLGFMLNRGVTQRDRRRRLDAHWAALDVESAMGADRAKWFRRDLREKMIGRPLYRLPTAAFDTSLPALLAEGALSRDELQALSEFGLLVHEINRGLDRAADAPDDKVRDEVSRVDLKCAHLLEAHDGFDAYIDRARKAIRPHLRRTR